MGHLLLLAIVLAGTPPGAAFQELDRVGNPNWSPTGEWIAFTGTVGGDYGLWLIHPDGTGLMRVPVGDWIPRWPVWDPTGTWLAFAGSTGGALDSNDLFVVRPDGSGLRSLTEGGVRHIGAVAWSPRGDSLAFYTPNGTTWDIYLTGRDGGPARRATDGAGRHFSPAWSHDGQHVLLQARRGGSDDLGVLHLATGNLRQLTDTPWRESAPRWSPDGRWISFEANGDGDWEIYRMRSDGSALEQLTDNQTFDAMSTWAPDGRALAWECTGPGYRGICMLDLASGVARRLAVRRP